jgi:hypothetical protein
MKLLTEPDAQTKAAKSKDAAVYIMHLWPNKIICPYSDDCMEVCLKTAGRGQQRTVRSGRYRKTRLWHNSPESFMEILRKDLELVRRRMLVGTGSKMDGKKAYVRLNGTSDIQWEYIDAFVPSISALHHSPVMDLFPEITFYDYTKNHTRTPKPRENYSLTLSRGSRNQEECIKWLERGGNVAVVFEQLPERFLGKAVINGDMNDLRPLDPSGVIVGLKEKGKAKKDTSGFVVRGVEV